MQVETVSVTKMNLSLLSLFSIFISCVSSETYYIVTSSNSHCPQEFRGEPCLTLKQYASHPSQSSNVTLIMESGSHLLQDPRFHLGSYAARSYSFIMTAQSAKIITTSSITITYTRYVTISGITFIGSNTDITVSGAQEVVINNCIFQGIRFHLSDVTDISISRCNFSDYSSYISRATYYYQYGALSINTQSSNAVIIEQCNFSNNERAIEIDGHSDYGSGEQSIYITESTFMNNTMAGAVYFIGDCASISVSQSIFINNTSSQSGGAIHFDVKHSNFSITVTESTFIQNYANSCGALSIVNYNDNNNNNMVEITESIFNNNRAARASDIGGGAMCVMNTSALIFNCTFIGNTAVGFGGALVSHNSTVLISNTTFHNNSAGQDGGALITYTDPSDYTITQSTFTHNQAGDDGGAIFVGHRGSFVRLEMCTFTSNHAIDRGGAITIFGSTIEITETSIDNNRAALGDTFSLCNSNVVTSIYGHRDIINCSYDGPSTSHFNISSASKDQTFANVTLNITIGEFCIEHQRSQPTNKELNKVSTAAYVSLTISVTIILTFFLYLLIEKLVRSKIRCIKASTVLSATQLPSEPLYDEATLKSDNAETIETKPNVLYERCEPQSQAQPQDITSS